VVDRGESALLSQANDLCSPHAIHVDDAAKLHLARCVVVDAALRLLGRRADQQNGEQARE
jgi:hypothetical protein